MAVRFYDEALFNKIKKWVKDPHMHILKPEETSRLFEIEVDTKNDKALTLPVIALSRSKDVEILCTKKQPRTFAGYTLYTDTAREQYTSLNVIPMKIGYQIDIYTKGMEEADEYVRNFIFNLVNYPRLVVELPYKELNLTHNATITLEESVTDNSDIKEHLFADQFVRFSLKLSIDDAYLFSVPDSKYAALADEEGNIIEDNQLTFEVKDCTTSEIIETSEILQ